MGWKLDVAEDKSIIIAVAAPNDCLDTNRNTAFTVCDQYDSSCTDYNHFHPNQLASGRFSHNTLGTYQIRLWEKNPTT